MSLLLGLALAFSPSGTDAAETASAASASAYEEGLARYAEGDDAAALAAFEEAVRLDVNNQRARRALERLRNKTTAAPRRHAVPETALEHLLLVQLPRWFYFERTLGDALRDVGELSARNSSVLQLMAEREVALSQKLPFPKERQLRALLRRAPTAVLDDNRHYS